MAPSRRSVLLLLTASLGSAAALMGGWPGPYWRLWDRAFEDQVQVLLGQRLPPKEVVVVAIDEATLQQGDWFEQQQGAPTWARGIGALPWPRAAYGLVAERLLQAGARAVAIKFAPGVDRRTFGAVLIEWEFIESRGTLVPAKRG